MTPSPDGTSRVAGEAEVSPAVLPVSAIVVARDEALHLRACLPPLCRHCDEVLVVDLESSDTSAAVAVAAGAKVLKHEAVPMVELVYPDVAACADNDWLLLTDPDERVPETLFDDLAELLRTLPEDVGVVFAPLRFRFAGRPLKGTIWGGTSRRRLLVHRGRTRFVHNVHAGVQLRAGYRDLSLPSREGNDVDHYWVDGWRHLSRKHRRYLRLEGASRYRHGQRTSWRHVAGAPLAAFRESFVRRNGYRDGLLGLGLSLFWAWYSTRALLALRLHQRRMT